MQPHKIKATLIWTLVGLAVVAVGFRTWWLGHIPGLNGDEAWYGVKAQEMLSGNAELRSVQTWLTPTGNPLNPFYFIPQLLLHAMAGPSIGMLRLPALLSGLAALGLNFWLARRAFGLPTAAISTLLLTLLPVNIAYSRFGWDASQTLLATVVVTYLLVEALRSEKPKKWFTLACVAWGAAMLVHPTNIFLGPLLAAAAAVIWKDIVREAVDPRGPMRAWVPLYGGALLLVGVAWWFQGPRMQLALSRLGHPAEAFTFFGHYVRLFSGVTIYQYIPGSVLPEAGTGWRLAGAATDIAGFMLAAASLVLVAVLLKQSTERTERVLAAGYALCVLAFFILAGPRGIAPHFERYALFLIAPAVLLVARAVAWAYEHRPTTTLSVLTGVACLFVVGFYVNYFAFFKCSGGASHVAFRTGDVDPKQQAVTRVLDSARDGETTWILTSEWWNYWPARYLAADRSNVRVETWESAKHEKGLSVAIREGRAWFLEFSGSKKCAQFRQLVAKQRTEFQEQSFSGYADHPVVSLIGPARPQVAQGK